MQLATLAGEREAAALAIRGRRDDEVPGRGAADSLDARLTELLAEDRLARRRAGDARVEVDVIRLRPLGDLRATHGLDDRALVDPVGEAVERRRAGARTLGRAGRLTHQHLKGLDLVRERGLAGLVARGCSRRGNISIRTGRSPTTLHRASTEVR